MNALHTVVLVVVILAAAALWISAVVSIARSSVLSSVRKAVWLLATLVLPVLGPLVWFVSGRPRRIAPTA